MNANSLFIKYFKLIAIALIAILSACKKDELSQLPLITQTGEDTFGCLVNGKAVTLKNGSFWNGNTFYGTPIDNNIFLISFYSNNSSTPGFGFYLDSLKAIEGKTYLLSRYKTSGFASADYNANINANPPLPDFKTNDIVTGSLTITKYSLYNGVTVLAGIFNYNAVDAKGDTVKITNGRFDFRP
jgi:hypothetical protein